MGLRGPKPTPTKILEARGSWRARLNRDEPVPEQGAPRCPSWLSKAGKAAWKTLVPELVRVGIFAKIDANAFSRYCDTFARWRIARDFLAEHGDCFPIKKKDKVVGMKVFPQARLYLALSAQLDRLEAQFGLNPSARSRIEASGIQDETTQPAEIFELRG